MIELEKLYESAGQHLAVNPPRWEDFATEFYEIFGAGMVIYRPEFEDGVLAWRTQEQIVVSTHPDYAAEYVSRQVFEANQIPDDSLNPFEPNRRSDIIPDDVFRQTDIARDFFIPRGIFYMLAVSARLRDDSYLMMVTWRSEQEGDFDDIEKQRITLFFRYLSTLVSIPQVQEVDSSSDGVKVFGKKYALTSSEIQVLSDLLQGKSLKAIAKDSGRSYGTVRWHVQNILEKCHVKSQKNLLSEFYSLIKR